MLIEDGTGSGRTAAVNSDNRLEVVAVTASTEHNTNHADGLAFNVLFEQTPSGADPSAGDLYEETCIFYLKNTSDIDMTSEGILFRLAGSGLSDSIEIRGGNIGDPIGETTVIPANLNLGSGNSATGIFSSGNSITGLTGGTVLQRMYIESGHSTYFNFDQDIIIPRNRIITIWSMTPVDEISITLSINYHPIIGERS